MRRRNYDIAIIPLANFESEEDKISLEKGFYLRRISPKEANDLVKMFPSESLETILYDTEFVIEKELSNVENYSEWVEDSQNIVNVILALRLLKAGEVFAPTTFFIGNEGKSKMLTNQNPIANAFMDSYFLEKEEIDKFIDMWNRLKVVETEKKHLVFALKNFSKIFYDTPDQLVKYVMSFESIVFGRGECAPRPIGITIGIAIAMFIGKNEKDRAEIEKVMFEAYKLRNKIVHGHLEFSTGPKAQLRGIFDSVEEYLRRSLRKILEE